MIEIFKLRELSEKDLKQLNHVNPWWTKNLNKIIKKNKVWISKFNTNPNDFIPFDTIEQTSYDKLFRAVNNYLNFFKPKLTKIITDDKLFRKFDRMFTDYMSLVGFCMAIDQIIEYYNTIDSNDVDNKHVTAMQLGNKTISVKYTRFKNEIYKVIKEKDILDEIFANEVHNDKQLFESNVFVHTLMKFAAKLMKAGKLEKPDYLKVVYLCYVNLGFNQSFNFLYNQFLYQIK
ncbi:hypothetical protein [[Acholeplasma] multilocale]|uniref:hypothetical protein n=1 Tax=[Acholeplasma] multilocale TaxID=264638 RepID=UPI00047BFEA4|nr:hypothetical protein [[Acholeplasma] multilocale]